MHTFGMYSMYMLFVVVLTCNTEEKQSLSRTNITSSFPLPPSQITMLEALLKEGKKERCKQEVELVVAAAKQIAGEVSRPERSTVKPL